MNKSLIFTAFLILALLTVSAFASCKYKHSNGSEYDFTNGDAAELTTQSDSITYTFTLCDGAPTNPECAQTGANSCLIDGQKFLLSLSRWTADNGPIISEKPEGGLTLEFRNGDAFPSGATAHLIVDLDCSNDISMSKLATNDFESAMEVTIHYAISHPRACSPKSGLSGGAIFLIVFFSLLAGYFVIGAIVCKFVLKQSGIKVIPQHAFWCALPGLFVAGVKYLISCFTKKSIATSTSSSDGYDSV